MYNLIRKEIKNGKFKRRKRCNNTICVSMCIIALVNINVNLNNKLANLDAEYKKIQQSYSTQGIH